jgi:hypothetical protein
MKIYRSVECNASFFGKETVAYIFKVDKINTTIFIRPFFLSSFLPSFRPSVSFVSFAHMYPEACSPD